MRNETLRMKLVMDWSRNYAFKLKSLSHKECVGIGDVIDERKVNNLVEGQSEKISSNASFSM